MSDNYFLAENPAPDEAAIAVALGEGYVLYERLLEAAEGFERDWKHYGGKYGWKLKAHDGIKALFELTIGSSGILVGIAARESEMQALLASELPAAKSKQGWGIRVFVADEASCGRAIALIRAVAEIRRGD